MHIKMNKKHKRGKNTKEERKIKRRNKKMRITKREIRKNTRNNASSLSCDDYNFTYFSRNNNSNTIWRQWNNQ